jgi:hypothetical protein
MQHVRIAYLFFTNVRCHIIKNLLTSTVRAVRKIFNLVLAVLTSLSLSQYSESSVQRRLDSRPPSIMGIERLIPRVASLTVDCRGVKISLTKPIWKLSNDKSVSYFVKTGYCCIVAILIMTCVLLYQVYLF